MQEEYGNPGPRRGQNPSTEFRIIGKQQERHPKAFANGIYSFITVVTAEIFKVPKCRDFVGYTWAAGEHRTEGDREAFDEKKKKRRIRSVRPYKGGDAEELTKYIANRASSYGLERVRCRGKLVFSWIYQSEMSRSRPVRRPMQGSAGRTVLEAALITLSTPWSPTSPIHP